MIRMNIWCGELVNVRTILGTTAIRILNQLSCDEDRRLFQNAWTTMCTMNRDKIDGTSSGELRTWQRYAPVSFSVLHRKCHRPVVSHAVDPLQPKFQRISGVSFSTWWHVPRDNIR